MRNDQKSSYLFIPHIQNTVISAGGGVGGVGGGVEKTENFNSQWGWFLNRFFISFSNHENYSIKNICVYSRSKIKTKVTSKQNQEHLKMINRR